MEHQSQNINEENLNNTNSKKENDSSTDVKRLYNLSLAPYFLLAVLRVILTIIPQTGYIQPDEYFQSVEIVNEDIFGVEASRPWEFNVTKPIRSVTLPYMYVGLPTFLLKCIAPYLKSWFDCDIITPYFLLIIPRLSCCLLSFINDWSLYKICVVYEQNYRARLLTLASSYVLLVYGTHTFSNTIEMTLMSVLVFYVANCMYRSDQVISQDEYLEECYLRADNMKDKIRLNRLRKSLPGHSFSSCVTVASLTVLGVFNRPTFLAFAFTPVFFWLHRGLGSKNIGLLEFHLRIILLGLSALPMTALLILIDSFYFGYLTWSEILHKKISLEENFVVTPYNFVQYNAYTSNLANHGLHPRVTHFLFNIPLLYNVLGIAAIIAVLNLIYRIVMQQWSMLPRIQSIIGLMMSAYIVPIALLSIFPHQEPRFLIPVTLPLVFLHSQRIRNVNELQPIYEKEKKGQKIFVKKEITGGYKDKVLTVWYLVNMIMVLVYGFVHQAGVYPLMEHFSVVMKEKPRLTSVHLVTSFVYPLPISLLHLQRKYSIVNNSKTKTRYQTAKDFFIYEMGLSDTVENAAMKAKDVLEMSENTWQEKRLKYQIYLALPTSRLAQFQNIAYQKNITHTIEHIFYPHMSTEAMPDLPNELSLQYLSNVVLQFGLALIKITK